MCWLLSLQATTSATSTAASTRGKGVAGLVFLSAEYTHVGVVMVYQLLL